MSATLHYWNDPTEIFCGADALSTLAQRCALLGKRKPLLVTDPGMLAFEPFALLATHLEQSDVNFAVFADISANPSLEDVGRGVAAFKAGQHDSLSEQALADISSSDTNARPLTASEYSHIFRNAVLGVSPGAL